ncbi:hypothetical protein ACN26Y_24755 [Micromonospora sp. WMMD558]|uniref:hypothetical protein n=1 Tax=unclassified Micromonospora TaxID=2617518 RepID=UPI00351A1BFB
MAMKLFSDRAVDYFRSAGPDDRRYLPFNPMTKMKVTTEGEKVIDLLWDVIAAKGFEADNSRHRAHRPDLGTGRRPRRRVRDAPLTRTCAARCSPRYQPDDVSEAPVPDSLSSSGS